MPPSAGPVNDPAIMSAYTCTTRLLYSRCAPDSLLACWQLSPPPPSVHLYASTHNRVAVPLRHLGVSVVTGQGVTAWPHRCMHMPLYTRHTQCSLYIPTKGCRKGGASWRAHRDSPQRAAAVADVADVGQEQLPPRVLHRGADPRDRPPEHQRREAGRPPGAQLAWAVRSSRLTARPGGEAWGSGSA